MRKHNEGYALVLVLVVLVVLCLLSSYLLSFSLRNLENQQAAASRLQDQYTAAGEIEKIVGQLEALTGQAEVTLSFEHALVVPADKTVSLTAHCGSVQIDCTLELTAQNVEEKTVDGKTEYVVTNLMGVEYVSYKISMAEKEGGE